MLILSYGTRISASTSGAGKSHLTPQCKTSHDCPCTTLVQIAFTLLGSGLKQ